MITWTRTVRLQRFLTIGHRQVFLFSHLTYLVQLPVLYLVKLSRPRYRQKLNKIMKISQEDVILIKNICLSKQCGARRALSELPDKGWKLGSIDSLLKRIRKTGTIVWQPGSGRPVSLHSSGGLCAQSGGQAKKTSVSSLDFTWNCHSIIKCTQENNSPWSPAQMLQTMPIVSLISLVDKRPYCLQ